MKSGLEKIVSRAKGPLSAALILSLLFVQTLVGSSALHSDVHSDAAEPSHECAVTLLSNGQVDVSEPILALPIAPVFTELREIAPAPFIEAASRFLPSSRGPPSLG